MTTYSFSRAKICRERLERKNAQPQGEFRCGIIPAAARTVAVAQLVESRIVIPVVVGSSPIGHPTSYQSLAHDEPDGGGALLLVSPFKIAATIGVTQAAR
jgi:hypothetical protein